jgi:hypothetical protein
MDIDQRTFLNGRLKEAMSRQPELGGLRDLLLRVGGEELVPPPWFDSDVANLIQFGSVMEGRVKLHSMERSACHANVARLWGKSRWRLMGIGTGYALSDDGLWRQHSWGVRRSGILETTQVRSVYFGIVLSGVEAERFAIAHG